MVVSDLDPIDPIECGFAQSREEALKVLLNRVQLMMYKEVTPIVIELAGLLTNDHDLVILATDKLAGRYGYRPRECVPESDIPVSIKDVRELIGSSDRS